MLHTPGQPHAHVRIAAERAPAESVMVAGQIDGQVKRGQARGGHRARGGQ